MPTPRNPYPYGLSWQDLKPEPFSSTNALSSMSALNFLLNTNSNNEDMERVFDAALALAMRMTLDPEFSELTRGQILSKAIDTAVIWERG